MNRIVLIGDCLTSTWTEPAVWTPVDTNDSIEHPGLSYNYCDGNAVTLSDLTIEFYDAADPQETPLDWVTFDYSTEIIKVVIDQVDMSLYLDTLMTVKVKAAVTDELDVYDDVASF